MIRIILVALAGLFAVSPAFAQKLRSADTGSVTLVLSGTKGTVGNEVIVSSGDELWTETVKPYRVKVLTDPVEGRIRPTTPGVAAGTTLIGVRIASGTAYCPVIDYDANVSRVQCFQDLDDDGLFDGGYYTDQRGFDTQFLSGWLRGLAALAPKIAYSEKTSETKIPTGTITVRFQKIRKGVPRFQLYIEKERLDDSIDCAVPVAGQCHILGRSFSFEETANGGVKFTALSEGEPRGFSVSSYSEFRK
jgi:hypothetical protein